MKDFLVGLLLAITFAGFVILLTNCGQQGPSGVQGLPGTNLTPVSIVQFCPGTASYPSVFPESALCISNKLYGVFWMQNSSWLGEIPPGNYASTSTSLQCNFSVNENCVIINY